jgi:hypothetical protein
MWCEQQAVCEVQDEGITIMNLVCSGFRPDLDQPAAG